jgi:hypothetical protein
VKKDRKKDEIEIPASIVCDDNTADHSYDMTSIIFHASLKMDALLGYFDSNGRWQEGILLRKIRYLNSVLNPLRQSFPSEQDNLLSPKKADSGSSHLRPEEGLSLLVLNGPLTYQIEQLLHGTFFQMSAAMYGSSNSAVSSSERFTLPTGEFVTFPRNLKIIIETSDLSNASPTCLASIASRNIDYSLTEVVTRLLTTWMRSLGNWLGEYAPWLDFYDELSALLTKTKFLEELLYFDAGNFGGKGGNKKEEENISDISVSKVALIISKLSAFFRICEELFQQIQELALKEATVTQPENEENSSSDEDEKQIEQAAAAFGGSVNESKRSKKSFRGIMSLAPKFRSLLLTRARLSVIYAAVWGLGGGLNCTKENKRKRYFENILRESISQYFERNDYDSKAKERDEVELNISRDCSLFDCLLDIERCSIHQAYQINPLTREILQNKGLSDKYSDQHIYCEHLLIRSSLENDASQRRDRLKFHSVANRSVSSIASILISSGANVMLFGEKGCGKTALISDILEKLKANCPTPEMIRQQISDNLINIINGIGKADGIFRTLELLNKVLLDSVNIASHDSVSDDFNLCWRKIGDCLSVSYAFVQIPSINPFCTFPFIFYSVVYRFRNSQLFVLEYTATITRLLLR